MGPKDAPDEGAEDERDVNPEWVGCTEQGF